MNTLDRLEMALRRLPHITYVGYGEHDDTLVVQVLADRDADGEAVRWESERLCEAHLDRRFVVESAGPRRPARIRLLDVEVGNEDGVVVYLGFDGICTAGRSDGADHPTAAAAATFEALEGFGAAVPFRVDAAALFEHDAGDGVMVVLGSDKVGPRYGVAAGSNVAQAGARATLHALNRYLATQPLFAAASA